MAMREDGGNRHRTRQNGSVRGGAADIGDEGGETVLLEADGVGWRQIVSDHDQRIFLGLQPIM